MNLGATRISLPLVVVLGALSLPLAVAVAPWLGGPVAALRATLLVFLGLAFALCLSLLPNPRSALLGLLMIGLIQRLYQALALEGVPMSDHPMRVMPALVTVAACVALWSGAHWKLDRPTRRWMTLWLFVNIPAFLMVDTERGGALAVVAFLYPMCFFVAARAILAAGIALEVAATQVFRVMTLTCLCTAALIVVEVIIRGNESWLGYQLGDPYSIIGAVLLVWPLLILALPHVERFWRWLFWGAVLAVLGLSFSRGGLAILGTLVLLSTVSVRRFTPRGVLLTLILVPLVGALLLWLGNLMFADLIWTWGLRLNIVNNVDDDVVLDLLSTTESERKIIWEMAWDAIQQSPFIGHGLGSSPHIFATRTGGAWAYSSAHSLTLTVWLERGIFAVAYLAVAFGTLLYKWFTLAGQQRRFRFVAVLSLMAFLAYAHSTGNEMVLNSNYLVNADVTALLFMVLALLLERPRPETDHGR